MGIIMKECSKSISRRMHSPDFINSYFVGEGLDIGGKPDPLALYKDLFCQIKSVKTWDWEDGDAQFLRGVTDGQYDFVHSSHCLEHLIDPIEGVKNWLRVVREGGFLIITVPDEDMYEQGSFPSTFNLDHKWTFTINKNSSWSNKSINILDLIKNLGSNCEVIKVELLASTYRYSLPRYDQTLTPVAECGIELVIRKRPKWEVNDGGRLARGDKQPDREILIHLNQYQADLRTLKEGNKKVAPFSDDSPIDRN
jgi:SAM-dependent methyltransferase